MIGSFESQPVKILNLTRSLSECSEDGLRIKENLSALADLLHFDSIMLTSWTPSMSKPIPLATSYDNNVSKYLTNTYVNSCPGFSLARNQDRPVSMNDTPFSFYDTVTYNDCLGPAGFREGITYVLKNNQRKTTGILYMSSGHSKPLSKEGQLTLLLLTPTLSKMTQRNDNDFSIKHIVKLPSGGVYQTVHNGESSGVLEREEILNLATKLAKLNYNETLFYRQTSERIWWKIVVKCKRSQKNSDVMVIQKIETPPMTLTFRELEVANLTCFGFTNPEIANELNISLSTVKSHLENLYCKLGVNRRSEVPMKVFQHNLYVQPFHHST